MTDNPYLELTAGFNRGRLRSVLSSGQAVVVHRLAVMSKDGDWILREDQEALGHVLRELVDERPLLTRIPAGRDELERALDAERRTLMRNNEERIGAFVEAAREWAARWPEVSAEIAGLPLTEAHRIVVARAEKVLPFAPGETP